MSRLGESFVDFVCPECWHGKRQQIPEAEDIELSPEQKPLSRLILFHESLRCEGEDCGEHARVHTVKESEEPEAKPKKPIPEWTLVGICCPMGHPVKDPPEAFGDPVPIKVPDAVA